MSQMGKDGQHSWDEPDGNEPSTEAERRAAAFARYCESPPPDSALARAIAFGIDRTLTFHNAFGLTPVERLAQAGRMINAANSLIE